jgi:hypothetical protein
MLLVQCCGSKKFLTGSGSDFRKRLHPDTVPDPDLHNVLPKFLLEIFLVDICSKKYIHKQKKLGKMVS